MIWPGPACLTKDFSCASIVPLKAPIRINYLQQFKCFVLVYMLYTLILKYFSSIYPTEHFHSSFKHQFRHQTLWKKNLPYPTYTNFIILATSYPSVSFFSRDWDPPTHIQLQKSETYPWDFLGSPVVRTLCFHCRGPDSMSGQGNKVLRAACVILNTNGIAFITLFFIS